MKRWQVVLVFSVAVMMGAPSALAEDPAALLEKGVHAEVAESDLTKAVGAYELIVAEAEANRPAYAEAYYRLATCYSKLGREQEAEQAFRKIVELYPEQARFVAKARRRLPANDGQRVYSREALETTPVSAFIERMAEAEPGYHDYAAMWALIELAKNGPQEKRDEIVTRAGKILTDADDPLHNQCTFCYVLSGSEDERAIAPLAQVLRDAPSSLFRGAATCALGAFVEVEEARQALETAKEIESDPEVQDWIRKALAGELVHGPDHDNYDLLLGVQDDGSPGAYAAGAPGIYADGSEVLGEWKSVDFVDTIESFDPGRKSFRGDLYLKGLTFKPGGETSGPWSWGTGYLWHPGDQTKAAYEIREIGGEQYLFMQWMSGDVTIRGMKPKYYVMKRP